MLRIGIKRGNTSTSGGVEDQSTVVEPPLKRLKVASEHRHVSFGEWWGQRAWNSLIGGLSKLFKRTSTVDESAVEGCVQIASAMDSTQSKPAQTCPQEDQTVSQPPPHPDIGPGSFHQVTSPHSLREGQSNVSLSQISLPQISLPQCSSSEVILCNSKPRERRYCHLKTRISSSNTKPLTNSTPCLAVPSQAPNFTTPSHTPHFTARSHTLFSTSHTPHFTSPGHSLFSTCHAPHFTSPSHTLFSTNHSPPLASSCYTGDGSRTFSRGEKGSLFSPVLSPEVIGPSQSPHYSHKDSFRTSLTSPDASVWRGSAGSVLRRSRDKHDVTAKSTSTNYHCLQAEASQQERVSKGGSFETLSRDSDSSSSYQSEEMRKMSSYLAKIQSDHKRSVEDKRSIAEVIERKLQFHQQQRMALEDARMTRLREQLSGAKVSVTTKEEFVEVLAPLSEAQEAKVATVTRGGSPNDCLSQKFNIRISRSDLATLSGLQWLNDEVINFYFNLIKEDSAKKSSRKVHVLSSFFYPKLSQSGYKGVQRWTRKVDIFAHDLILLPVHMGMHWTLAAIDFSSKSISYYDSLGGNNNPCLQRLRDYLLCESRDKKGVEFELSGWSNHTPKDIPHQQNGSDCGVFMCMYARYLAARSPFTFSQEEMPIIRQHIIAEILEQRLF